MVEESMPTRSPSLDAVIIGAGIAGVKQLHELRKRGLNARVIDAAGGVGGTWYWNRYPGCRFDVESYTYGYFSEQELLEEWSWSEEFAGQPEIERYVNFVVDRLGLRSDIQLNTRIVSATWDEKYQLWVLTDSKGAETTARYLVTALGVLSAPQFLSVPGKEDFAGEMYHTGLWPHSPVDFNGKRVAVIGTGSSGVQIIPVIAETASQLTVFQRSANWCTPLSNKPITSERMEDIRSRYTEIDELVNHTTASGFMHVGRQGSLLNLDPADREAFLESIYDASGMTMLYLNYQDATTNREANRVVNDFLTRKIYSRVQDPDVAVELVPTDHGFGSKRPPQETKYYEAYNRANVRLVPTKKDPVKRFVPEGIETESGVHEFDVIVFATGFEAVTGSYSRINITGVGGRTLNDVWADGPLTYYGLAVPGFPNMLMAGGPQSTRGNISRFVETQTAWIGQCIADMTADECTIEADKSAAVAWGEVVEGQSSEPIYFDKNATSWAIKTDTSSGRAVLLVGTEGLPAYRKRIQESAANGYKGFHLTQSVARDMVDAHSEVKA